MAYGKRIFGTQEKVMRYTVEDNGLEVIICECFNMKSACLIADALNDFCKTGRGQMNATNIGDTIVSQDSGTKVSHIK